LIGIFGFLFVMWLLILLGGAIVVTILGPFSISGYGDLDLILTSVTKAAIAISLATIWILILSKVKNWIFRKEIKS